MAFRFVLGAALAIVLASCGAPADQSAGQPASSACGPVEQPRLQGGQHLLGDRDPPVPYSSTPPTSGWHASGVPPFGVADRSDPLTEPEQVSVLEAGGIVVTYGALDPEEVAKLETFGRSHADQVAVTPYGALEPGQVALTAWGRLQRCDGVDTAALSAFLAEHGGEAAPHGH